MKKLLQRRTGNPIVRTLIMLFLILYAILQIYPLIWLVFFSFKSNDEIFGGNILGPPEVWRFENYKNALLGGDVLQYLINSVWITLVVIILSTILIAMVAYAVSRMKWKLSNAVYWFFMAGLTIPLHATLLPMFILFKKMGILDTPLALIIPYTAFALPFGVMVLRNHYETIPREMEEAACIDGCSIYQTFFYIIVPLVRPTLATIAVYSFLGSWNELMFAMTFISNPKYKTLTVGLQSLSGMYYTEWGPIGAGIVISTLPVLIIYALMSKQVQNAMLAGATKG